MPGGSLMPSSLSGWVGHWHAGLAVCSDFTRGLAGNRLERIVEAAEGLKSTVHGNLNPGPRHVNDQGAAGHFPEDGVEKH